MKTIRNIGVATLLLLLIIGNTAFANFLDVNEKTDYRKAIMWMFNNGIVQGYSDETFRPEECVNRAEFLKMLFKTFNIPSNTNSQLFKDIPSSEWYAPYILTARARGTIEGYPDGTFKPSQCVNRVEAVKMAILEFGNGEIPGVWGMYAQPYDVSQMDDNLWWQKYLNSAQSANLVGDEHFDRFNVDYGDKAINDFQNPRYNFGPDEPMPRKEVAEMLYRMKYAKTNNLQYFPGYEIDEYAFDGCGKVEDYADEDWYEDFVSHIKVMQFSEACLSLDGKTFISLTATSGMYEYNYLYKYKTETGEVEGTVYLFDQTESDKISTTADYYVTGFGKRVGDYIEVEGDAFGKNGGEWKGKYYYLNNTLEKN